MAAQDQALHTNSVKKLIDNQNIPPTCRMCGERPETMSALPGGVGVLPYIGYIGMCHCEGYGFQAVYSSIRYINQSVWV